MVSYTMNIRMTLNKKIIALVAGIGFVGYIGLAKVVNAESNAESKTLKEWGVPNVKGLNLNPRVEWVDCSDKLSGKETKLEWYLVNGEIIGIYSFNVKEEKLEFAVVYDKDMKDQLDFFFIDYEGKGIFTKTDSSTGPKVPDWVIDRATNKE
ncbi:MAG: hypothetical protein SCARUB_04362 [Candidatus Scalindua rubra]|uniref:Uncharacterized protein n=1 Tax=Candidatus Scalindua rubra TaxID=1872076 RepID=A0A1E3X6C5_9BACT|nr:MAG: hypothetical protein SCARUB_04362 [Candidatus Scalindua rubra]